MFVLGALLGYVTASRILARDELVKATQTTKFLFIVGAVVVYGKAFDSVEDLIRWVF